MKTTRQAVFTRLARQALLLLALGALAGLPWALAQDQGNAGELFAQGNKEYNEMSFGKALTAYDEALKAGGATFAHRDLCRLRIAQCQMQLAKFDEAIASFEAQIKDTPNKPITVDVMMAYANMRVRMPHYYTQKGEERKWGGWISGGEHHYVREENLDIALKNISAAKALQTRLLLDSPAGLERETRWAWRDALATIYFHEAAMNELLENHRPHWENREYWQRANPEDPEGPHEISLEGKKPKGEGWEKVPNQTFRTYPRAEAIMQNYVDAEIRFNALHAEFKAHVESLKLDAESAEYKALRTRSLGYLERAGEASYRYAAYLAKMDQASPEMLRLVWGEEKWQTYNPLPAIDKMVAAYPKHYRAPEALMLAAYQQQYSQRFIETLAVLARIEKDYPDTNWAKTCPTIRTEITRPRLYSYYGYNLPIGQDVKLDIQVRNIKEIDVEVFKFDLAAFLKDTNYLDNPNVTLGNINSVLGQYEDKNLYDGRRYQPNIADLSKIEKFLTKVGASKHATRDNGKHRQYAEQIALDVKDPAVYLVRLNGNQVYTANLLQLSTRTLVCRPFNDRRSYYLADRQTGTPIGGNTEFIIKEYRYRPGSAYTKVYRDVLDTEMGNYWHIYRDLPPQHEISAISAFAKCSDGEIIFRTQEQGRWWWNNAFRDQEFMGYTITDRPIYRPKQTINFTSIIRHRKAGSFGFAPPAKGTSIFLEMYDSKGSKLVSQNFTLDDFGQIKGEYTLGNEPALGSYTIYLRRDSREWVQFNSATHYFRVEEYKKPEFAVTVESGTDRAKVGSEIKAKIEGRYFFGAPVADGEVKYRVFRHAFIHTYHFPGPFDWLYGVQEMWAHRFSDHWNRYVQESQELVKEGAGRLDAEGQLLVTFDAGPRILGKGKDDPMVKALLVDDPGLKRFLENDYEYSIEADVTDPSRRVISGSGSVKVTRQSFGLFSNYQRNFYRPKSRVEVELRSVTPNGKPMAVKGQMHVEQIRQEWFAKPDGNREIREVVERDVEKLPFATDENGVVFIRYVFETAGLYRLTFTAPDPEGGEVSHVNRVLICGEDGSGRGLRFDTLEIVPEKRFYAEGETISCAILTSDEGMTAHTMVEIGDGGIDPSRYAVRMLKNTSTLVTFPAHKDYLPNVFLTVTSVRNNQVHAASVEVFIPPVKEFLTVSVTPDKAQYSPGEKGKVTVTAKDAAGNPVKAQFVISVADEAVYAIQEDTLADIRQHFYGRRRYLSFYVEHSQNQTFYGAQEDRNKFGSRFFWGWPENPRRYQNGWLDRDHLTAKELEEIRTGTATLDGLAALKSEKSRGRETESLRREAQNGMDRGEANFAAPARSPAAPEAAARGMLADKKNATADDETGGKEMAKAGEFRQQGQQAGGGAAAAKPAPPRERKNFQDTAIFKADVQTDDNGVATLELTYPDNLTTWRILARGATASSQVGEGRASSLVTKNIIVRLAAPRFFMESDEVVLSTIVNNRFDVACDVEVKLSLPAFLSPTGSQIPAGQDRIVLSKKVTVPAKGQLRQDWPVKVLGEGEALITCTALSERESDEATLAFPAHRWGQDQYKTVAGVITNDGTQSVNLGLPAKFDVKSTWVRVGMTPTVASACIDAVPYLIEYPYGCIEQTMSRFMPAVVVRGALRDMGIDLGDVQKRRAMIEMDKWDRGSINRFINSPVFDNGALEAVITYSLYRIAAWQNGDGGWGWFQGFSSDPNMTAYVIHGLWLAKQNGIDIDQGLLDRGLNFLGGAFLIERNLHRASFMAYALAPHVDNAAFGQREQFKRYLDTLMKRRADFNHLSRSYFALALHHAGRKAEAKLLISNIEDYAKVDEQSGTAFWKTSSDGWWLWWNDALQTNTAVLRSLSAISPEHKLIEPLSRWVLNHRQGNCWESTQGTSLAILALMDYARNSGQLEPNYTVEISYGGRLVETVKVTRENMLALKPSFVLDGAEAAAGNGEFTFKKTGPGFFGFTATVKTFNQSEKIEKFGYEIFIEREYVKLTPKVKNDEATDGSRKLEYERSPLKDGDVLESGELIEVVVKIDSKNDYEYVLFEDYKPAGYEAVNAKSGYTWADGLGVFIEFRDARVAMFAQWVPQGKHTLTYRMRAEVPGKFHALPCRTEAMYAPLVRSNSDSMTLSVKDKAEIGGNK